MDELIVEKDYQYDEGNGVEEDVPNQRPRREAVKMQRNLKID